MPLYSDEAVVLRTHKLAEADRIITLLTREHGVVRAVARGVRRTSSRFGARLEPFGHVDLMLAEGRSLDIVTQAESLRSYGAQLVGDYAAYTAGTAMLEAAERLVDQEGEPAVQQYLLLVGGLRAMTDHERPPSQVLDAYLLRSLAVAGWGASFDTCARCGAPGPHVAFNPSAGGVLCPGCRLPGSARPAVETVQVLGALLSGDWEIVGRTDARHLREASRLVAGYASWHLERGLTSLSHVAR
jgi:DNA repair protein RecO (recombination protein O)